TRDVIVPTRSFSTRPHPINERCPSGAAVTSPRDPSRVCAMFSLFERLLKPTDLPEQAVPPPSFTAFFWHYARQAKGLFAALFAAGLVGCSIRPSPYSWAAWSRW